MKTQNIYNGPDIISIWKSILQNWTHSSYYKWWIELRMEGMSKEYYLITEISTGGLSSNEILIDYLKLSNVVFKYFILYRETRGGHFEFRINLRAAGFLRAKEFCELNNISRQAISKSPHLYEVIRKPGTKISFVRKTLKPLNP